MSRFKYFPLIKTRDAELKCFQNLGSNVLDSILPIYELTKSRKTTRTPDGDIHRRMNQISEIQQGRPFILDLCTNDNYINPQIEQLIDEYNGFHDWQYFITLYQDMNIIPMIHLYQDAGQTYPEVEKFVKDMSSVKANLAVRLPYDLERDDINVYLEPIINNLNENCTLFVILDANYIRNSNIDDIVYNFSTSSNEIRTYGNKIEDIIMLCTSFPRSPASLGEDHQGSFKIYEEEIFRKLKNKMKYGDYASVNTEQVEIKGGTFIPRIDISLEDTFIYKRYRREKGSYNLCAIEMKKDHRYQQINSWADKEIDLASKGKPTGISPSFWISVRMNYYITSRLALRLQD
ncbi:beta family protein [Shewanella sp. M16]|uniref:beta family protein n=1 Tax=Shewanella sp. M16 TaxID=2830837 RepID=UPI001BB0CDC9|nr:beta family protein [Shewanella sp. M16]MBS0044415.1 beta family protein [Shewanella sp. M16]